MFLRCADLTKISKKMYTLTMSTREWTRMSPRSNKVTLFLVNKGMAIICLKRWEDERTEEMNLSVK